MSQPIQDEHDLYNIQDNREYHVVEDFEITDSKLSPCSLFSVEIDGQDHTITVDDSYRMFHIVSESSTIKNLNIRLSSAEEFIDFCLICRENFGTIKNINIIVNEVHIDYKNIAFITHENHGLIEGCQVLIDEITFQGSCTVSGITNRNNCWISNCSVAGFSSVDFPEDAKVELDGVANTIDCGTVQKCKTDISLGADLNVDKVSGIAKDVKNDSTVKDCNIQINIEKLVQSVHGIARNIHNSTVHNCSVDSVNVTDFSEFFGLSRIIKNSEVSHSQIKNIQAYAGVRLNPVTYLSRNTEITDFRIADSTIRQVDAVTTVDNLEKSTVKDLYHTNTDINNIDLVVSFGKISDSQVDGYKLNDAEFTDINSMYMLADMAKVSEIKNCFIRDVHVETYALYFASGERLDLAQNKMKNCTFEYEKKYSDTISLFVNDTSNL